MLETTKGNRSDVLSNETVSFPQGAFGRKPDRRCQYCQTIVETSLIKYFQQGDMKFCSSSTRGQNSGLFASLPGTVAVLQRSNDHALLACERARALQYIEVTDCQAIFLHFIEVIEFNFF